MAKKTDQQKSLRHLSRSELIEIIYRQQLLLDDLQQRLADSKEKCGELNEQIRNFETNRSLSAHTERLDADIQNMAKQLDVLNDIIRRSYSAAPGPVQTPSRPSAATSAPLPPMPPPPSGSSRKNAGPIAPPIPRRQGRSSAQSPSEPPADQPTAPTIAQQLKGQPFRAEADK
ncbi:MAG: hypothetical protein E7331_07510 [Clostridiales bacterium]|nr:hypothetical protein [Clostridiales bacterium]